MAIAVMVTLLIARTARCWKQIVFGYGCKILGTGVAALAFVGQSFFD